MSAIYKAKPSLGPRLIVWGSYDGIQNVHFLICDFRNMADELPDINEFVSQIAELCQNGTSPHG